MPFELIHQTKATGNGIQKVIADLDAQRPRRGRSGHRLAAGCLAVRQRWWRGRAGPDERIPLTTSLAFQYA
jgi:hypothetical protein